MTNFCKMCGQHIPVSIESAGDLAQHLRGIRNNGVCGPREAYKTDSGSCSVIDAGDVPWEIIHEALLLNLIKPKWQDAPDLKCYVAV